MIKIAIINHTFQNERFYKRWKMLADRYEDIDVTLLAPAEWTWGDDKNLTFGSSEVKKGNIVEEERFHIRLIDIVKHKYSSWTSKQLPSVLREINPDIVYYIGVHTHEALYQVIRTQRRWLPKTKVIAFSMRGKYHALRIKKDKCDPVKYILRRVYYLYGKYKLHLLNKYCSAVFCHYPDGMREFIREGFKKPIYMQTQVGVDTDYFHPDAEARRRIREKYNIGDAYCFGSASRFNPSKGLFDIIAALPEDGNWKFLMMGSGLPQENENIRKAIEERGLQHKIILTGMIELEDMSDYWNALDCAVHVPKTTEMWEETFSLALVQAMATGLPVIGNTSGSVPYQIGPDGIILKEGDIRALHDQFCFMLDNPEYGKEIGKKMYERATKCFSITHLTDCFYDTIVDIYNGIYDSNKVDMTTYRVN